MPVACPHCAASNADGTNFCVSCGKAVPTMARTGPRVLSDNDLASSSAGQNVQLDDLARQIRPAVKTLFWVGLLHMLFGGGIAVSGLAGAHGGVAVVIGSVVGTIGAAFLALSYWARKSPLPATITGLTIYSTLVALDLAATFMSSAPVKSEPGMLVGLGIRISIIAVLSRAVSAAVKHRALSRQRGEESNQGFASSSGRMAA